MIKCELCNKTFKNIGAFSWHFSNKHSSKFKDKKEYFDSYMLKAGENLCKTCGKETTFISISKGYKKHCNCVCSNNDPDKKRHNAQIKKKQWAELSKEARMDFSNKIRQSITKYFKTEPEEHKKSRYEKAGKFMKERWKTVSPEKRTEISQKISETVKERYGTNAYFQSNDFKEKRLKTIQEKYGEKYTNNSQTPESQEKSKLTCLEKYGVEYSFQSDNNKEKTKQTVLEKYGVEYYCLADNCRKNINRISKPNRRFENLLKKNNIKYIMEKRINNLFYDFFLEEYNLCVEINPSITHNIDFSPFGTPLSKEYHVVKRHNAELHGLKCVCLWDWDDFEHFIDNLLKNKLILNERKPKKFIYNYTCKKLVENKEGKYVVEIWDDGQDLIWE